MVKTGFLTTCLKLILARSIRFDMAKFLRINPANRLLGEISICGLICGLVSVLEPVPEPVPVATYLKR